MADGSAPSVASALRPRDGRSSQARADRAARSEITAALLAIGKAFSFQLAIPGQHYGGLSNTALLDVRVREGRPFDKDTRGLRERVRIALLREFEGSTKPPSEAAIREVIAGAVLDLVVKRVESGGFDIDETPLTPAYRKAKTKAGFGGNPIGMRTGKWLGALKDKGRVDVALKG